MGGSMYSKSSQSHNHNLAHTHTRRPLFPVPVPVPVPVPASAPQSEGTFDGSVVRKEKKPTVSLKDAVMRHLGVTSLAPGSQGQQGPDEQTMKKEKDLLSTPAGSDKANKAMAAAETGDKDRGDSAAAAATTKAGAKPRYPLDCIPDGTQQETDEYVCLALDELTENLEMMHFFAEGGLKFKEEKENEVEKMRNELAVQKIWNKDLVDKNSEIIQEKMYLVEKLRKLKAATGKGKNDKDLQEENKELEGLKQEVFVQKARNKVLREEKKILQERLQEATFLMTLTSQAFQKNAGPNCYKFNPEEVSSNIHEVGKITSSGVQEIFTLEKLLQDPTLLKKLNC